MAQLQYGGLQRADGVENVVVAAVYAVEAKAQAAGVELALGEMLYAGAVADVAQYLVVEGGLQLAARLVEQFELAG